MSSEPDVADDAKGVEFSDPVQFRNWLGRRPLTNAYVAQTELSRVLENLQNAPLPAMTYLELLEAIRVPIAAVHAQLASGLAARPLPPSGPENAVLGRIVRTWQELARAYAQVERLTGPERPGIEASARVWLRCVQYSGLAIIEHFRARRELPKGLWSDLHRYFARAEEAGVTTRLVPEPVEGEGVMDSCASAYARVLLIDLSNPYGRSPQEFEWICRWARIFAPLTAITKDQDGDPVRTYAADLGQDRGVRPLDQQPRGENVRLLDSTRLAQEMQTLLRQLKLKKPPADLGLGEDCPQPVCGRLLLALFRPWGLVATGRRLPRRRTSGVAQLCGGFDAIHHHVGGRAEFAQPEHVPVYTRQDYINIATFRERVDDNQRSHHLGGYGRFPLEDWEVMDHSMSGFRLRRNAEGFRLEHGELVGLRPPDADIFLLCRVTWLMYESSGNLVAGVFVLPGMARSVGVRATGLSISRHEQFIRGFLLADVPALKEKESLVLPRDWFTPARVIDIFDKGVRQVRLEQLVAQGANFERITFAWLDLSESPASRENVP